METINYTSTTLSTQILDTFDLPTEKIIYYKINVISGNTSWYSTLDINHDGIQTSEEQIALAKSGITPLEFVTSISNNVGTVSVTPTTIPTTFSIERNSIACNLYSENTLSGRNILTEEGLGIYFSGANNITIRQSNNNIFTYANAYVTSGVMGPIKTKNNILTDWSATNGSLLVADDDYQVVVSSGQKNNCQTQILNLSPGKNYILSGNAYYTTDSNISYAPEDRDTGPSKIQIGTEFNIDNYGVYFATATDTSFSIIFSATSNTAHVSFGFGDINNRLYVKDFELKEYVPFHTYDQDKGAMYINWSAVAAGNTILSLNSSNSNNRIYIDSSNNVFINTVNCGSQQVTNKLVFNYNANGISVSRNGNSIITSSVAFDKYITSAVFVSNPNEFGYMSDNIANTLMVAMSNV